MAKVLLSLLLAPLFVIFYGFVLSELWSWFIVPLGVMDIGALHAYGLVIVAGMLTWRPNAATEKESDFWVMLVVTLLVPLFAWGFGAIIHYFM